jgi:undecaprenyl diphosphate synthase
MSQSTHVAIIMDGNGRWAQSRGWPRIAGHRAGVEALRRVAEAAPRLGVGTLTLYAFSADNWKRPAGEVSALMGLFERYLQTEADRCVREGVRVSVIGRRDRLAPPVRGAIATAERLTAGGQNLHLRLAVDYSGRQSIQAGTVGPDVDLLIRTGGEQRLSDFLLWESAYAELYFTPCMWPDFGGDELRESLEWFRRRQRRFGALPAVETLRTLPQPVAIE